MTGFKVSEIATALSARHAGDGDIVVQSAREPGEAGAQHLAVAMSEKYSDALKTSAANVAILWEAADWQSFGLKAAIFVERPRLAMASLTAFLKNDTEASAGIHPTAIIDASATVQVGAEIGPYVVIGAGVHVGSNARIASHVYIGQRTIIGSDCKLEAGVKIGDDVTIGDKFIAYSGAKIGSDGFSFVTAERSHVEVARETLGRSTQPATDQQWLKINSIGGVLIGDDVELGANSNIDAGTISPTTIGSGTKIDALVHIAHNVKVGSNCLLCGFVGIAGSSIIGDSVILGGRASVADNITIGRGVIAGGASVIMSNVPAGRSVLGYPAVKMDAQIETYKATRRLPRLLERIKALEKLVSKDVSKD